MAAAVLAEACTPLVEAIALLGSGFVSAFFDVEVKVIGSGSAKIQPLASRAEKSMVTPWSGSKALASAAMDRWRHTIPDLV